MSLKPVDPGVYFIVSTGTHTPVSSTTDNIIDFPLYVAETDVPDPDVETWELTPSENDTFKVTDAYSHRKVSHGQAYKGSLLFSSLKKDADAYTITPVGVENGQTTYVISVPGRDLVWTVMFNNKIDLEKQSDDNPAQKFLFHRYETS